MNPSTLSTSVIHDLQNVILASSDDAPSDPETEENPGAVHVSTPLQGDSGGTDYFDASIWGTDEDWSWNDAMAALDVPFEPLSGVHVSGTEMLLEMSSIQVGTTDTIGHRSSDDIARPGVHGALSLRLS
jgi:hypothetical protein